MALRQEVWHQDPLDEDLWLGENGLLVNTTALEKRTYYFEVIRVLDQPMLVPDHGQKVEHAH